MGALCSDLVFEGPIAGTEHLTRRRFSGELGLETGQRRHFRVDVIGDIHHEGRRWRVLTEEQTVHDLFGLVGVSGRIVVFQRGKEGGVIGELAATR